jgi:cyclophilin family peptidyl-prolyl cis-trans isomerase
VPIAESAQAAQAPAAKGDDAPIVVIETSQGTIIVQLDRTKAPITVDNFLKYVDKGFYDGLVFHRVIPGFMIQGGGMEDLNGTLKEKETLFPPIKNESDHALSNAPGTIAMARTGVVDSATSQFFINHADNSRLDHLEGGYTAFGKVIEGLDVVDAIAKVQTTIKRDSNGNRNAAVPVKPVLIKSIKRKS